jgi:hypothetical protein
MNDGDIIIVMLVVIFFFFLGMLIGSEDAERSMKQYIIDQGKAEWVAKQNGAVEFRWK